MRDFLDIKVGDIVVVYDEYNHDYDEHYIEVESVEYDDCNVTETNPKGMTCYGKDLNWWNDRLQDYDGDDYITNVTESNFVRFKEDVAMERKYYEVEISKHDNRAKNGKRNETSMCIVGVREPSIKEAEKFLADDIIRVYKCDHVDKVREISKEEAYSSFNMENENDFPIFGLQKSNFKEEIEMNRINIVMKALKVDRDDAKRIVEHLIKHGCEEWIDDYIENGKDEPLTNVHYEKSFDNMIDWQYEGSSPSEMLGKPTVIEEYLEMLQLKDKVIFWYGLV